MSFVVRSSFEWKLRTRSLPLGKKTPVIGVLNVTPDSFSDGGVFHRPEAAVEGALAMLEAGAAIIDVGGESTRPGKHPIVPAAEEMERVVPVIEGVLRHRPEAILSIDTYKAETARTALAAGAEVVNDVSGLLWDPEMPAVCATAGCGLILMHTRGRPEEWRRLPKLSEEEVLPLVKLQLRQRLQAALEAGISRDHIVLDPGFGFGKSFDSNYPLLAGLAELRSLGQPLLAGVSRKSFLARTLAPLYQDADPPLAARQNASLAAATAAILAGADMIRAHDVAATIEAAAIADAILLRAG
jgi:dihydropteroate synthase